MLQGSQYLTGRGIAALSIKNAPLFVYRIHCALDHAEPASTPERRRQFSTRIHQKRKWKAILLYKPLVPLFACRIDAENHGLILLKLAPIVPKTAQLSRTAGSVVAGIEHQNDTLLPSKIGETNSFSV